MTAMNTPERGPATSSRRADIVRVLKQATGSMTIAEIAAELGVHPNTIRFHLETLVEHGQVERVAPDHRSPGRPPLMFRAVRRMDPSGPRNYQLLAQVLLDSFVSDPDPSRRGVEAGRRWGRRQAGAVEQNMTARRATGGPPVPGDRDADTGNSSDAGQSVEQLMILLDRFGFAPERQGTGPQADIGLRHCPFLELAETSSRKVVCPIHLGLMQGAMEAWRSPVSVDGLDAFVEPDLCVAHLNVMEGT